MITANSKGIDITRNIRIIEMLKSELLEDVAQLYRMMASQHVDDTKKKVTETLSNVIVISYLLGKRLGIEYEGVEKSILSKIRLGLIEENEIEKFYGDLSELARLKNA